MLRTKKARGRFLILIAWCVYYAFFQWLFWPSWVPLMACVALPLLFEAVWWLVKIAREWVDAGEDAA